MDLIPYALPLFGYDSAIAWRLLAMSAISETDMRDRVTGIYSAFACNLKKSGFGVNLGLGLHF